MTKIPAKTGIKPHIPIMVEDVVNYLNINQSGTYADCTIGYGGHAFHILKHLSNKGRLIGIDKDDEAIEYCKKSLFSTKSISLFKDSYHYLPDIIKESNIEKVDGILLDLGLSSMQLDSTIRGFSFKIDSELDMRFDSTQKLKAVDILNSYSTSDLANIIFNYGGEKRSRSIAKRIVSMRPIRTTFHLVEAIRLSTPPKMRDRTIARVFQSLRIKVNNELDILEKFLSSFYNCLSNGGRIIIISFHSLEDRLVKHAFKNLSIKNKIDIITKKPRVPSEEEQIKNSRCRSAKLRVAERI